MNRSTLKVIFAVYAVAMCGVEAGCLAVAIHKGCALCTGVLSLLLALQLAIVAWTYDRLRQPATCK